MDTETWPAPQPAPPVKKSNVWRNVALGLGAMIVISVAFSAGEETGAKTSDPGPIVQTTPHTSPATDDDLDVTAADVVDTMGPDAVDAFCALLAESYGVASESTMFGYFAEGYGEDDIAGLPTARAVWNELKSRCAF